MSELKILLSLFFVALLIMVTSLIFSYQSKNNTKFLQESIQSLTVQIDSINELTQKRLDSVQIITEKKTEIKNYYIQKFYEIDSLNSDTSLVRFIREQLQNLRSVQQLHH